MQSIFQNRLLRSLSEHDLESLVQHWQPVDLRVGQILETANDPIDNVYFPESGLISVVTSTNNAQVETGMIGFEGMTGLAVVLGNHQSPSETCVQLEGRAHKLPSARLREILVEQPQLRLRLQRYALVFMCQVSQSALANARATLETRLVRWLLMAQDRHLEDELHITHEFLSVALCVRRAGVTDAIHALESKGVIEASRGAIRIVKRNALITLSNGTYGLPEAEYERLLG